VAIAPLILGVVIGLVVLIAIIKSMIFLARFIVSINRDD